LVSAIAAGDEFEKKLFQSDGIFLTVERGATKSFHVDEDSGVIVEKGDGVGSEIFGVVGFAAGEIPTVADPGKRFGVADVEGVAEEWGTGEGGSGEECEEKSDGGEMADVGFHDVGEPPCGWNAHTEGKTRGSGTVLTSEYATRVPHLRRRGESNGKCVGPRSNAKRAAGRRTPRKGYKDETGRSKDRPLHRRRRPASEGGRYMGRCYSWGGWVAEEVLGLEDCSQKRQMEMSPRLRAFQ